VRKSGQVGRPTKTDPEIRWRMGKNASDFEPRPLTVDKAEEAPSSLSKNIQDKSLDGASQLYSVR